MYRAKLKLCAIMNTNKTMNIRKIKQDYWKR